MESLKNRIREARNISDSSLNAYMRNMKVMNQELNDEQEFNPDNWIGDFDKVKEFLKKPNKKTGKHSISTEKTRIATILVVLRLEPEKNKELIKKYTDYLDETKKIYEGNIASHKKSLRESENWCSLEDLKKVFNKLAKQVRIEELNKANKVVISKQQKDLLQQYLVAGLYVLIPPNRNRDFSEMKFISNEEFDNLSEEDKQNNNYLVIKNRQKKFFSFGDYKNKKYLGRHEQQITGKLNSVINLWLKFNKDRKNKFLLLNSKGGKMSANSLTKYLMKIFSSTGKNKISSCMLRHIYATHNEDMIKYREAKKKAEENATNMKHTLNMNNNYVKY
jgi:hypothetical protein